MQGNTPWVARADEALLAVMPVLVARERTHTAEVIEHLLEIDRRRLYLDVACTSLSAYCMERLGYAEDEASKRVRVARLARRFPVVLGELRAGRIHLTGLLVLAPVLTEETSEVLLMEARRKTKREIEQLVAGRFPRPDVAASIMKHARQLVLDSSVAIDGGSSAPIRSGAAEGSHTHTTAAPPFASRAVKPLSSERWAVQFTARTQFREKLERCFELLSHVFPHQTNDLPALLERALDAARERDSSAIRRR